MYEDYQSSYVMLLEKAKLPALHVKRMRILAVETFKILNKFSIPSFNRSSRQKREQLQFSVYKYFTGTSCEDDKVW